jgi:cell division protein FtsI (penicillin-binding protein 3)
VGFVGEDGYGLAGIEQTFNEVLSPPVAGTDEDVFGNQVFLTIDVNAQYTVEQIVAEAYQEHEADSVMAIVADADNGEVLAYVSAPTYDSNDFESYPASARQNRPIDFAYEPGSVLKIFTLASILELGGITPQDTFYCPGYYPQDGGPVILTDLGAHGTVDVERILMYSCNVGAATASESVKATAFYEMLRLFGFSKRTGVPLPGESYGILRKPEDWSSRSKPTIAMGQEISVSAMQMAAAATALTNGGTLLRPHVVRKVVSPDGKLVKEYPREPVHDVISPGVAKTILRSMQSASGPDGTARRARIEGVPTSAKTGTAEMIDPATGTYSPTAFVASCLSIFPTDDPELIVYVVIEHPKGESYYGGVIAAPLARRIAEEMVTYFGIRRAGDEVIRHPGRITVPEVPQVRIGETMPDLTGLPKRSLLPLYERDELTVVIRGEGWVVSQSPPPGTLIARGDRIVVDLE